MLSPKHKLSLVCSFLFISLLGISQTYVDGNKTTNGNGSSWSDAYNSLEDALNNASPGDEIWVAEDTYTLSTTASEFNIPSGVAVYGGFEGNEVIRSARSWVAHPTLLDGGNTAYNVVFMLNANSNTILDGFTIRNGEADGTGDITDKAGAGLFIQQTGSNDCKPTIQNCTFNNNFSTDGGGAVYINTATIGTTSPVFNNCTFDNNSSNFDGGAVYINASGGGTNNASFLQCIFSNNMSSLSGGAIFNNGNSTGNANMSIKRCNFEHNTANSVGGAIYNNGSNSGNSSPTIFDSRFYNNRGNLAAGAIYNNGGSGMSNPTITNCTFYANSADQNGGAIYNNGSGSGQCKPLISNCIIYGNTLAPPDDNRSYIMRNVDANPTIQFCLVDAADCTTLKDLNNGSSTITCGSGMIYNQDPVFVNAASGDLHLQEPSPAIHAGNNALNGNTEDLDGNPRNVLGIDLGAYEVEEGSLPIELADFRAFLENGQVTISWITISETDNDYFVVERSVDGRNFEALEVVPGAGNSTNPRSYKVYDYNPFPGKNYYRLKDVSYSGESAYSPVRIVETNPQRIKLYPNPTADYLHVNLLDFPAGEAQINIYNAKGQLMYTQSAQLEAGTRILTINAVQTFLPGSYYVVINAAKTKSWNTRFEKIGKE